MLKKIRRYWYMLTHPVIGEVWQLHRVTEKHSVQERKRPYEITPKRLESLIEEYKSKGYEFISMAEVAERMRGKKGKKFVAITLDDGYANNYDIAYPFFKKYNIPFCIYVCEKMILGERKEDNVENYSMLTIDQIKTLDEDPLCTIGAHTKTHIRLTQLTRNEQQIELQHCKIWLEGILGHKVMDYAYPYGDYNADTLELLAEIGVDRAVASWGGACVKTRQIAF